MGYIIASAKEPGKVHIHKFVVRPEARGKGIGKLMMQDFAENVKDEARYITLKVYEDNNEAINFYRMMSFYITGHHKDILVMEMKMK